MINDISDILVKYKGKMTVIDSGAFYCLYIPLQYVNTTASIVDTKIYEEIFQKWTTFIIPNTIPLFSTSASIKQDEVIIWCQENLGRMHKGIYLKYIHIWLGNFGNWHYDYNTVKGLRIWIRDPTLITLFKLRWG
jgi:hypothetical protein